MTTWLAYDPARISALLLRSIEAADHLDAITCDDPLAAPAIARVRRTSFTLRTTWLPVIARIGTDRSLTAWSSVPPAAADPLSGLPASARDDANRASLERDIETLEARERAGTLSDDDAAVLANARATQNALAEADQFVDPVTGTPVVVHLYVYEPAEFDGDGRGAIGIGDLDTAANIAVTVPGLGTELSRIGTSVQQNVYTDARQEYPGETVAVLAWSGYDAPSIVVPDGTAPDADDLTDLIVEAVDVFGVATMGQARSGAARLADDVAGINAMRATDAHVTVIGNSYGSTTVAIAADEFGLEADDVILTGSPGAGNANSAADLTTGTENTWVASASDDPVTYLGDTGGPDVLDIVAPLEVAVGEEFGLGNDPAEDDFGAQRVAAEWSASDGRWTFGAHGHYYDVDSESNENIASIVMGHPEDVELAEHRHKDEDLNALEIAQAIATLDVAVTLPDDPEAQRGD